MKLSNNKILITGGASGIGLGLTKRFVEEGNTVIICGRREDVLKEVVKQFPTVITHKSDLSLTAERQNLFDWIQKEHPDTNILVNNAGIQNWMHVTDHDFFAKASDEITINIEA